MICSDMDGISDNRRQIAHYSDLIIMALINSHDPVRRIMSLYEDAESKQAFVAAMAASLLLRQRQWQAIAHREWEAK